VKDYEDSISEAESYLEMAESYCQDKIADRHSLNPVVVNCIMSMIKTVDALMQKHRGKVNKDHSKTANELRKLYEENLIAESFSSNVDSVRKWVVDEKTDVQYRNKKVSEREAKTALKSARRLLDKAERELGQPHQTE
jgi:uncharacterized protein (UPF0332 family)